MNFHTFCMFNLSSYSLGNAKVTAISIVRTNTSIVTIELTIDYILTNYRTISIVRTNTKVE